MRKFIGCIALSALAIGLTAETAAATGIFIFPAPAISSKLDYVRVSTDGPAALFLFRYEVVPDFHTVDGFDRQVDSFQFYISDNPATARPMASPDYLIRGDEIHSINAVDVCTTRPFGSGCPGGWGVPMGNIAFSLSGTDLNFEVLLSTIGGGSGFSYDLLTFKNGAQQYSYRGTLDGGDAAQWSPFMTAEPSTALLLPVGFLALLGVSRRLKRKATAI